MGFLFKALARRKIRFISMTYFFWAKKLFTRLTHARHALCPNLLKELFMKKIRAIMMIDANVESYKEAAEFETLVGDLVKLPSEQFAVQYADAKVTDRRDNGKEPNIHAMKFRSNQSAGGFHRLASRLIRSLLSILTPLRFVARRCGTSSIQLQGSRDHRTAQDYLYVASCGEQQQSLDWIVHPIRPFCTSDIGSYRASVSSRAAASSLWCSKVCDIHRLWLSVCS